MRLLTELSTESTAKTSSVIRFSIACIATSGSSCSGIFSAAACATIRDALGPLTNLYSPAAYKRELARTLLRKAVMELRGMPA